jgi:hypothetical protein
MEEDGGGDVVRDISYDLQLLDIGRNGLGVKLKDILVQDLDGGVPLVELLKVPGQLPIQLHQDQAPAGTHQVPGQCPLAGTDLQDFIVGLDMEGLYDLLLEIAVNQEVLSQGFLRPMRHWIQPP